MSTQPKLSASESDQQTTEPQTSSSDVGLKHIEIYPNPATDNFYLDIEFLKTQAGNVEIFDTEGEKLKTIPFNKDHKGSLKIKIPELENGNYMVCVRTVSNDFYMDRLIVMK